MAMSQEERREKGEQAYHLHIQRLTYTEIGQRLDITRQFASVLVKEEQALRSLSNRDDERESAKATYELVVREGWLWLSRMNERSLNVSGILNSVINAQSRIDEITGIRAPKQVEGYLRRSIQCVDVEALSGELVAQLERELLESDED